jgi:dihydrofolate reductase
VQRQPSKRNEAKFHRLKLIVAHDAANGIGRAGSIPWHLLGDLKHVSQITRHTESPNKRNCLIMGKNTYFSIPADRRPLAGRLNFVISRSRECGPGASVFQTLDEATIAAESRSDVESVFFFGGGQVYREVLTRGLPSQLIVTKVFGNFGCDTFFPDPLEFGYSEVSCRESKYDTVEARHSIYEKSKIVEELSQPI